MPTILKARGTTKPQFSLAQNEGGGNVLTQIAGFKACGVSKPQFGIALIETTSLQDAQ